MVEAAPCDPTMTRWLRALVPRSRLRAERAQFAHDLPNDEGERLFQAQDGLCAVSGVRFRLDEFAGVLVKHPFAPSLDRISSLRGYIPGNVRLVCIAVNFGMGQWGEELYLTFARAAVERSNRADHPVSSRRAADRIGYPLRKDAEPADTWLSAQRERLAAAETISLTLSGKALLLQRRRIASLKRNLSLGRAGLNAAAAKAVRTRAGRRPPSSQA